MGRRGYLLLLLLMVFTLLLLGSLAGVLEQDTSVRRLSQDELKSDLDALRKAIDFYRFRYGVDPMTADPARIASLNHFLDRAQRQDPPTAMGDLLQYLLSENYIRSRLMGNRLLGPGVASGTGWRVVRNLVRNGSFEWDDGRGAGFPYPTGWRGNSTGEDGVPDGWQLTSTGAEQKVEVPFTSPGLATFVASFWVRVETPGDQVKLRVWPDGGPVPLSEVTATDRQWRRYFTAFNLAATTTLKVEVDLFAGNDARVDGVMLERWQPPLGGAPAAVAPSAFTEDSTIVSLVASATVQQSAFTELVGSMPVHFSTEW